MREILGILAGAVLGATAMYYLDPDNGRRRRAMVRDKLVSGSHEAARGVRHTTRWAAGRARGVVATGHLDGMSRELPLSDAQLRERVRSRLGRLVSHPGAIDVQVDNGSVRLSGDILTQELDGLLSQVRDMAGVQRVINALSAHDSPSGISGLQGRQERAGLAQAS
jgi:gas vesicle protein